LSISHVTRALEVEVRYDDRAARERVAVAMPHMAVYHLCILKKGPLLDQLEAGGELRGLSIFKTASLAEAQALAATDPMVNIGHLVAEIHPWMIRAGALP
jgi:hypothetical protein